ncbi:TIGR01459 family HAD-type hydrolase [Dongia sedimenti]|uniref:TIGR01459 family HAD-type hydrolase n=1 Tax=Dongia sedimenti TaxID=3064282 RepID=A0ABU0YUJ1_9PROT|nr:TIGR01459 family HAD-type hydrolase [Rhodospirillaceae bacterium R-7]
MTEMIARLQQIADRFDHVLLDQYGVLHHGKGVFVEARDCVASLHDRGKTILVLSNSGKRSADNLHRIAKAGLEPALYDGVLSSGEVAWQGLRDRKSVPFTQVGRRCFLVTRGPDRGVVDGLDLELVDLEAADFILLAGLDDGDTDIGAWRERLAAAAARNVPMLCANPDLTMFTDSGLLPAPGALAQFYEGLGGAVSYIGKPHRVIFEAALQALGHPKPERVLMIGDSLDHDILGGRNAGILTLLVTSGVHREALVGSTDITGSLLRLAGSAARMPHWAIDRLVW